VDKNASGTVTGTKTYYPAGGAMRVTVASPASNNIYYVLKDHLGSASVLTTNTGAVITGADIRYYPFGEARASTTPLLTDRLFTGQREITGLGIYHYGARFYSPKLGRFLSADSIVPGYANPQNLNRFTYALNNPLRYTDPTGDKYCDSQEEGDCSPYSSSIEHTARKYRIRFKGKWKIKQQLAVLEAAELVGTQFASERGQGESSSAAFGAVYGHVNVTWGGTGAQGGCAGVTRGGCTTNSHQINFWSMSSYSEVKNVVHELGHAFDASLGYKPRIDLGLQHAEFLNRNLVLRPNPVCDNCYDWQQHPPSMDELGKTPGETFADIFIAWTYNAWNTSTDPQNVAVVNAAQTWMNNLVP
jgi:RHS repeat-associated protein